ncbi:MAG: tRNA preQ1(34) S-adenosylmethionine ribosyltransferase-isomerase QueA [Candidatus Omnitrophica bacterium]|nr:tRNA preQ1(34) S-adenosylmethionine ribosyltransferase-isomerase QueA [Candidatus Omnitrophota bacterium]
MRAQRQKLSDFVYQLPHELIAQYPSKGRSNSRLLVLERAKRKVTHRFFTDILDYFSPGDCLVLNNTKVVSARIVGRRQKLHPNIGGGKQEIFLLENLSKDTYRVLAKPSKQLTVGTKILFSDGNVYASVLGEEGSKRIIKFHGNGDAGDFWQKLGQIPLPPYIKREPQKLDKKRYQTVYAKAEGATAAPTAGLHFTKELLKALKSKGVNIVYLTLHINYGTFAPVKCEDLRKHKMYKEYFILPEKTAQAINRARARGNKVFAVGTTSVRVLETCALKSRRLRPLLKGQSGWTDLFVYPPYRIKVVDCLLTNFHFPKSTLLMLVSAFAARKLIFKAYQEAIEKRYRFFSYGDAMLII